MIKKICALAIACVIPSLTAQNSLRWLEIKPGYFFFSNHTLAKIYRGGFEIQGSVTYPLCSMVALYGSLGYIHAKGKSLHAHQKTTISQIPLDVGGRVIVSLGECIKGYLSMGPRYFHFHQHNNSSYVKRNIHKNGIGFFINTGCNLIKNECLLVGIFGEYAYERKSFESMMPNIYGKKDVQLGGFTVGASIGFAF